MFEAEVVFEVVAEEEEEVAEEWVLLFDVDRLCIAPDPPY